jgi:hypothetical protein
LSNYSEWEIKKEKVEELQLDPNNPRFFGLSNPTQQQIIEHLIKYENVIELALRISEKGFLPNEILIVCDENSSHYVLEGNRRLSACKLLLDYKLAPSNYHKRIQSLAAKIDKTNIQKVNVLYAPSRKDADYIIAGRHTQTPVKKWRLINQAIFYSRRIKAGESIESLSQSVGVSVSKIKKLVVSLNFCYHAEQLPVSKIAKDKLFNLQVEDNKDKFDLSTLDRVVQSKPGKEFLEVSYDDNGNIYFVNQKDSESKLKQIIDDIASNEINSRTLSKAKDIENYLKDPKAFVKTSKHSLSKKNYSLDVKSIVPSSIVCETDNERLKIIFDELQNLNSKNFSNAYAATLRLLIELGTYVYLERAGQFKKFESDSKTKRGGKLPRTWPQLSEMLTWISNNDTILDSEVKKSLKKYLNHKGNEPLLDDLNNFMHNFSYIPTKAMLSEKFKQFSEYLRHILKKYPTK